MSTRESARNERSIPDSVDSPIPNFETHCPAPVSEVAAVDTSSLHQESHVLAQTEKVAGLVGVDAPDSHTKSLAHTQPEQKMLTEDTSESDIARKQHPSDLESIGIHFQTESGEFWPLGIVFHYLSAWFAAPDK